MFKAPSIGLVPNRAEKVVVVLTGSASESYFESMGGGGSSGAKEDVDVLLLGS
jgi:hypothetical protein